MGVSRSRVGGVDVSTYVSSSILHVTQTGSIARLGVGADVTAVIAWATINTAVMRM